MHKNVETISGKPLYLTDYEHALLEGEAVEAMQFTMQLVVRAARKRESRPGAHWLG